ncbi:MULTISPECIES: LEA type 2 family protein [Haloferacaceae]|uniref:LEA type 2 family protein n=1 Tax=Halorubrum glutamatedens TaxID=2707018 RepID=A0ABD5QTJ2_9EURY|nr:LEA type 2 family protein [Halobellus captivus]
MAIGSVVSGVLGGKLRIALVGLLVVGAAVGGAFALGILGVPSVAAIGNTFGDVTNETTTIETDLVVSNPNPVGATFDDVAVNYTVSMNGIEMARGDRQGVGIAAGNSTIELETAMRNDAIPPWWTSHVRNGERTEIVVDATVASGRLGRSVDFSRSHEIETDLVGAFESSETRPVNASSALVDDPVLYVNETRGGWGTVSERETPIEMEFDVYNPNLEPYVVSRIGYDITMNGVEMGSGETDSETVIPSYGSETVPITTVLENERLDDWWVTHLDEATNGHQRSELRIEFYAVIEFPTGDRVTVPLDELTYEETVETDLFDEGNDVRDGSGSGDGDADDGGDGSETDGSGTDGDDGDTSGPEDDSNTDDGSGTDSATDDDSGTDGGNESDDDDDGIVPL